MRKICCWCRAVIQEEDGTGGMDSHGTCDACYDEIEAEAQAYNDSKPNKDGREEIDDECNL